MKGTVYTQLHTIQPAWKSLSNGAAELAQWIRAFDTLTEDMGSVLGHPRITPCNSNPGDLTSSSRFCEHQKHIWYTYCMWVFTHSHRITTNK